MKRIKNLGLVAIAALALTAVLGVAGASAAEMKAESYAATITSSSPYGTQAWYFRSAQQHCDAPQLEGTISGPSKILEAGAKNAACYDLYTGKQLQMNGCKFAYRLGAANKGGSVGAVDIVCPEGKTILFASGGGPDCVVAVPGQKGIPATYENVGAGSSRAVKVTVSETSLLHSQLSGTHCGGNIGTYENGTWSGSWKIQGSSGGGSVGVWVAADEAGGLELPPAGIAIAGSPPKLNAGTYPISISGNQNEGGQHVFGLSVGQVKCNTVKFNSTVSGPTAQLSVAPEYAGCTAFGLPGTISMNGCTYTFDVLNQPPVGSTYAGHADIACPAGKAIAIVSNPSKPRCTVTIGAQTTDSGGLSFTNESATSTIGLGLAVSGIDYHAQKGEGLGACTTVDKTNGTYTGSSTLVGSY